MKKTIVFLMFLGLTWCFHSCTAVDFDFDDPQDIEAIHEEFFFENENNMDLVELFGEENIHFGPVPPSFGDSICFKVDGLFYDTCVRYVFGPDGNPFPSHTAPPTYDPSTNVHLFYDHVQCIFKHKIRIYDTFNNIYFQEIDTAYIIGHDSLFTTYYVGNFAGNGNPKVAMIISGTLVFDTIAPDSVVFKGVRDYLFGKKILGYETQPTNAYAPDTIEIKKHPGLSPSINWNDYR